jgi:lipopolysaccharide kinase (Kdo/WaaP) family protein
MMKETLIVHPDYREKTFRLRDTINRFDEVGELVMEGERNTLKKVKIEEEYFNIKKFKTPTFFQGLVYQFLRKSKARRSFEYAKKLLDAGLKTPFPVLYMERTAYRLKESYYISRHLDYDFDFRVLNHNPNWPRRHEILQQFTAFTFQLHEKGINFLDHSPGNTLIVEAGAGKYDFYLIDLNRMRFESMDFNKRMKNFRRMWLSKTMINIMAPVYGKLYGKNSEETHRLMTLYSRTFQKNVNSKKLRKRRKI